MEFPRLARGWFPPLVLLILAACATLPVGGWVSTAGPGPLRSPAPPSAPRVPSDPEARAIYDRAARDENRRIVISLDDRRLWLVDGADTLFSAAVGIGTGSTFTYNGRTWTFTTPRGQRRIIAKETNPVWTPPDWHYFEKAKYGGLTHVHVERGKTYELSDGSHIEIRGDDVGRVNAYGNFWAFTPGMEIIFDGKIFIPPFGTNQRRVPNALGTRKLDMGDGYLIHGTNPYNSDSVGGAVSHGCVRMRNDEVEKLYSMVPVGTPVYIF